MASNVNLGSVHASLELDTKNFNKGIQDAQRQLKSFQQSTNSAVGNAQTTWRDGFSKIGQDLTSFGKSATVALTLPLTIFAKKALDAAVTYDEVMNMIRVASGEGQAAIDTLTPIIEDFGTRGKFSVLEVAQATRDMVKDGLTPAEIATGQLEAAFNLATGAGEDLYASQVVLSNAMASYGVDVSEAARFSDVLTGALNSSQLELSDLAGTIAYVAPIASNLKIPIEDLGVAIAAMGDKGIKGSMAGTTLRRALLRLSDPPKEAQEALNALGLEIFDGEGKMKSMETVIGDMNHVLYGQSEVLQQVGGRTAEQNERLKQLQGTYKRTQNSLSNYEAGISGVSLTEEKRNDKLDDLNKKLKDTQKEMDKLNGITGESVSVTRELTDEQRQQYLGSLFGSYAVAGMTSLVEGGTEAWDEYAVKVDNAGQAERAAEEASQGLAYEMSRMNSQFFLFKQKIGKTFEPIIAGIANALTRLNEEWVKLSPAVQKGVVVFAGLLAAIGPVAFILGKIALIISGEGAIAAGFTAISTAMGGLAAIPLAPVLLIALALVGAFLLIKNNLDVLKNILDSNIKPALQRFVDFAKPIIDSFKPVFEMIVEGFKFMWEVFKNSLQPAFERFGILLKEEIAPMFERILAALEPLLPVLLAIATGVGVILFGAFTALLAIITGAFNALITFFGGIVQFVGGIVEFFTGLFETIAGLLEGAITGDWTRFKEGINTMWEGIKDIFVGAFKFIIGWVGSFVKGIIDFFVSLADELVGHSIIPDMVNSIINWIATLDDKVIAIIVGMIKNFIAKFAGLLVSLQTWWTDLVGVLGEWKTKMFTWGENIAQAFVDGFGKLKEWLKEKARDALNAAKDILKGDSPPKQGPFKRIDVWGENVGLAWAEGFSSGLSGLTGLLNTPSLAAVVASPNIAPSSSIVNNSSPTFNVYVGMYAGSPMEKRQIAKDLSNALEDYNLGEGVING